MIKKFLILIISFNLISHCGFTPLHSNKSDVNFSITSIKFEGDKELNNFLKNSLNKFTNNESEKKYTIKINSNYSKNVLSKNKAAETTNFELSTNTTFQILSDNKILKELKISEKKIMDNIDDDFEEQKNEKIAKQNFASSMTNKLVTEISILNDN